jgi:hypothetical protein
LNEAVEINFLPNAILANPVTSRLIVHMTSNLSVLSGKNTEGISHSGEVVNLTAFDPGVIVWY